MRKAILETPIGAILITGDGATIDRVRIAGADHIDPCDDTALAGSAVAEAAAQIGAYFAGRLRHFDLPLAPAISPRGEALRAAIVAIPFGETLSYGELARLAASVPRAIGQACSRNPFPLIVPCHRVLASGGQLGHYSAGSGLATKSWLLDHENGGRLL